MGSRLIRVDQEVYDYLLAAKHRLEIATGKIVPIGIACAFLAALGEWQGRPEDLQG